MQGMSPQVRQQGQRVLYTRSGSGTNEKQRTRRTKRVIETEIETAVHDDANDRRNETPIKTSNAVRGHSFLVDIKQTIKLTGSSALG